MGAEIVACWRTIDPTFAAVMRVGAMLALVLVLSPPNVGQSALFVAGVAAVPRPPGAGARCWLTARETEAMIAIENVKVDRRFFIAS